MTIVLNSFPAGREAAVTLTFCPEKELVASIPSVFTLVILYSEGMVSVTFTFAAFVVFPVSFVVIVKTTLSPTLCSYLSTTLSTASFAIFIRTLTVLDVLVFVPLSCFVVNVPLLGITTSVLSALRYLERLAPAFTFAWK